MVIAAKSFDAAEYFDTLPALVHRTHNRPRRAALKQALPANTDKLAVRACDCSTALMATGGGGGSGGEVRRAWTADPAGPKAESAGAGHADAAQPARLRQGDQGARAPPTHPPLSGAQVRAVVDGKARTLYKWRRERKK